MDKMSIKAEIDIQTLLTQLKTSELELIVQEIAALIVQRKTKDKKVTEAQLIQKLNEECILPEKDQKLFKELIAKRENQKINNAEQVKLSQLIKEEEKLRLKRIDILGKLSQLKRISLPALMKELGIKVLSNG